MIKFLKSLAMGEDGATMVEYALMVALIAAAAAAAVSTLGGTINGSFSTTNTSFTGS